MKKENILRKLFDNNNLSMEETEVLFSKVLKGELDESEMSAILIALKIKGETAEEIAGAIKIIDKFKKRFEKEFSPVVDTCGTGGDGKNCFNVSTAVAITVSADGIPVVKHGNSAQSGFMGSADILTSLKVPVKFENFEQAKKIFIKTGFIFLFAPMFHPSMKNVAPVRKKLKVATIFNFIGPFVNPSDPDFQVTGISSPEKIETIANALKMLGKKNIILYSSYDGYDEISSYMPTVCYEINEEVNKFIIYPDKFFEPFSMPVVKNEKEAVNFFLKAISGEDENLAKIVALNSALIFKKIRKLKNIKEGFEYGYEVIKSGKVIEHFERLRYGNS